MASAAGVLLCVFSSAAGAAAASHPPLPATAGGVNIKWPGEPGVFADPPPMFRGSVDDTSCNVEEVERANTQQVCAWKSLRLSLLSTNHAHVLALLSAGACCLLLIQPTYTLELSNPRQSNLTGPMHPPPVSVDNRA